MDPGRLAVLLVLVIVGRGQAGRPGTPEEGIRGQIFMEEEDGPRTMRNAQTPVSLLQLLLQAMKRPGRSPVFMFQPQRFGRDARRSPGRQWLSPQDGEELKSLFWSLAAPQRFGRK